ncbi:MAG: acylphosphatase [Planctomycetota bacterium]|nr:acylphosphatase [Planctomycetota bacterium]
MPRMAEPNSPARLRLHALLSGRVQGVGMRMTVASLAPRYHLVGWVRNLPDGRVELLAEGPEAQLDAFLARLHEVMPGYIRQLQETRGNAQGGLGRFEIRY